MRKLCYLWIVLSFGFLVASPVKLGVDLFFQEKYTANLKNKKLGLLTNQTGVNSSLETTLSLFEEAGPSLDLCVLFSPEHGIDGVAHMAESVPHEQGKKIRTYSLHGETRRPTEAMLKNLDVVIVDIQDIGSRSYTYLSTLLMFMEEAAKKKIEMIVLDRPNPINGSTIDGPMLKEGFRSFVGYLNVPYCHGMTLGELALFFNGEYHINCNLRVIPMQGWKREMSFQDTHLKWIPTSPQIPEMDTPFFYPSTGILGCLDLVNIGVGYTLPFKIVGAPYIEAEKFADELNKQRLPGVKFIPFHFKPFWGAFKEKVCHGVKIMLIDPKIYKPVSVDYLLLGILKSLYPHEVKKSLKGLDRDLFCKINGNKEVLSILENEQYPAWALMGLDREERQTFLEQRKKYLLY